ncbi:MAG: isochorismatase family protein [Psychromonas sp.]|nr:isochorismatase family protein [Psychromonas sp.]
MYKIGSLFSALSKLMHDPNKNIALLIIDEENDVATEGNSSSLNDKLKRNDVTTCQQKLLMYMQSMNCRVWSISNLAESAWPKDPYDITRTSLKALYNGQQCAIRKPFYNAFRRTCLHKDLKEHLITHLVVMGWETNCCINSTIGMAWWPLSENDRSKDSTPYWRWVGDGATHLGYKVMTCNQILHGNKATWAYAEPAHFANLEFYSMFN